MNKQKIAKRLAYLWYMREFHTDEYTRKKMGNEKEDIYRDWGPDTEVHELSTKYYYHTHGKAFVEIAKEGALYYYDAEAFELVDTTVLAAAEYEEGE